MSPQTNFCITSVVDFQISQVIVYDFVRNSDAGIQGKSGQYKQKKAQFQQLPIKSKQP